MNITFIHTVATDVAHMGDINMFAVVHSTLKHCCISHGGPYVLGCANKKYRVEAAVAVISTPIILLTVIYNKTQCTGQLQLDNPDVVFSTLYFKYICLILTTSSKKYILQKDLRFRN